MLDEAKFVATQTAFLCVSLIAALASQALAKSALTNKVAQFTQVDIIKQTEQLLTSQQQKFIIDRLLKNPHLVAKTKNQRLRVLRLTIAPSEKETEVQTSTRNLVHTVVFNYDTGKASRFLVDAATGEILREEFLPGRPQPSLEEVQEAINILKAEPKLASLLQAGSIVEGGFAVDAPIGSPPNNRYIQMQILSRDRKILQLLVYVDLSRRKIAS